MSWIRIEKRATGLFPRYDVEVTTDTCARVGDPAWGGGMPSKRTFRGALRSAICALVGPRTEFPLEIKLSEIKGKM